MAENQTLHSLLCGLATSAKGLAVFYLNLVGTLLISTTSLTSQKQMWLSEAKKGSSFRNCPCNNAKLETHFSVGSGASVLHCSPISLFCQHTDTGKACYVCRTDTRSKWFIDIHAASNLSQFSTISCPLRLKPQ